MSITLSPELEQAVRERVATGVAPSVGDFVERAVREALAQQPELSETEYLLSSAKNAERLLGALESSRNGEAVSMTVDELAKKLDLR